MPYERKYKSAKPKTWQKRLTSRKRVKRSYRKPGMGLGRLIGAGRNYARHTFVRSSFHNNFITLTNTASPTATLWDFSLAFCLRQIEANSSIGSTVAAVTPFNNITDLTNLFEEYRIKRVRVTLIPHFDNHSPTDITLTTSDPATMTPQIYYVADADDNATVPMQNLMQMQGVKMHFARAPLSYSWSPKPVLIAAGNSSLAVTNRPGPASTWLDIDSNTTPYNALKFTIRTGQLQLNQDINFDMKVDYVIECKGIR